MTKKKENGQANETPAETGDTGIKSWRKIGPHHILDGLIIAIFTFLLYMNIAILEKLDDLRMQVITVSQESKSRGNQPQFLAHGSITKGKFISGNNNEPDMEVLPKRIKIDEKGYLTISANAEGKFDAGLKKSNFGMVAVKICINGIEYKKDVSVIFKCNGEGRSVSLAADAVLELPIDPGEYDISVIGVFDGGCIINPKTSMSFKVVKLSVTPPADPVKSDKKNSQ